MKYIFRDEQKRITIPHDDISALLITPVNGIQLCFTDGLSYLGARDLKKELGVNMAFDDPNFKPFNHYDSGNLLKKLSGE